MSEQREKLRRGAGECRSVREDGRGQVICPMMSRYVTKMSNARLFSRVVVPVVAVVFIRSNHPQKQVCLLVFDSGDGSGGGTELLPSKTSKCACL